MKILETFLTILPWFGWTYSLYLVWRTEKKLQAIMDDVINMVGKK